MYDLNVLFSSMREYLDNEREMNRFLKKLPSKVWLPSLPVEERVAYEKFDKESGVRWDMVRNMCQMVGIDCEKAESVVKAMTRYEKRTKYQKTAQVTPQNEQNIKRFLKPDKEEDRYYKTTFREIKA